jgi:hypothetical protein
MSPLLWRVTGFRKLWAATDSSVVDDQFTRISLPRIAVDLLVGVVAGRRPPRSARNRNLRVADWPDRPFFLASTARQGVTSLPRHHATIDWRPGLAK